MPETGKPLNNHYVHTPSTGQRVNVVYSVISLQTISSLSFIPGGNVAAYLYPEKHLCVVVIHLCMSFLHKMTYKSY